MIFVLGIERSATTWVANILDQYPHSDIYMEPLSGFNSRFGKWPDSRFDRLDDIKSKAIYFREEFEMLCGNRRWLLTRLSDSSAAWRADLALAELLVRKNCASDGVKDFLELNFHRKTGGRSSSRQPPRHTVIKELRLNYNADLLPELDPDVKVLVVIREMASCVRSIMRHLEKGNLVDLAADLEREYTTVDLAAVGSYWVRSYKTLLDTLAKEDVPHRVVSHTALMQNPRAHVEDIFQFLGWEVDEQVEAYLVRSDTEGTGKHDTRRSRATLLSRMNSDRETVYPRIPEQVEQALQHPRLQAYVNADSS